MPVTIAIDALSPNLTGIGRYCWELCSRLPTYDEVGDIGYYRDGIIFRDPSAFLQDKVPYRVHALRSRWGRLLQRESIRRKLQHSLFHSPNFFLPHNVESGIITVHDLSVFRYPETHPVERVKQFELEFESSMQRASHVLTDSETMRQEIIAHCGIAADRVTTTYMGVSSHYRPYAPEELRTILSRYRLTRGQYALCVSTLEPRKRIHALIQAWRLLPESLRQTYPLVLIGAKGWANESLMEDIERARSGGWLHILGYVAEGDLPAIYAGASLFLYPSIYEGFGLPPIEAMACGVPTIVANSSCLPEVTQGAAMLVTPEDSEGFALRIEAALTDAGWRDSAVARGLAVANSYSWERCVESTVSVYRDEWGKRQDIVNAL